MLPDRAPTHNRIQIGRYVVTGRIGRGGMGLVYRGVDEALEREVAIKTLISEGGFESESRQRFAVEAKAAARLQHPNIVIVYELGEDRGIPYIAMELLSGGDLEGVLRGGEPLGVLEKLDVVTQVCRGLTFAHERGIIHRDIKPSNIRLLDDGTAKIMDFGIAKLGGTQLTKAGMLVGTVHYMSPEQVRGRPLDGRSDVFSVGVILYELLSGQRPFRGEGTTQILYKIVHEDPSPLDLAALGVAGPGLSAIVTRALAKEPDQRYTASELGRALGAALDDLRRGVEVPPPAAVSALAEARNLLREDRVEEAANALRTLSAEHPGFVDAQRLLRVALRREKERGGPVAAAADWYPELEATFQATRTRREPATGGRADGRDRSGARRQLAVGGPAGRRAPRRMDLDRDGRRPRHRRRGRCRGAAPRPRACPKSAIARALATSRRSGARERPRFRGCHGRRRRVAVARAGTGGAHVQKGRPPGRDAERDAAARRLGGGFRHPPGAG